MTKYKKIAFFILCYKIAVAVYAQNTAIKDTLLNNQATEIFYLASQYPSFACLPTGERGNLMILPNNCRKTRTNAMGFYFIAAILNSG